MYLTDSALVIIISYKLVATTEKNERAYAVTLDAVVSGSLLPDWLATPRKGTNYHELLI